jgi:hypothetical protein
MNDQENFIVYYVHDDKLNQKSSDISIEKVLAVKPDNDILFIYSNELQNIYNLNIKDFSFVIFEEDINRLNDSEFEYFWEKFFIPWLENIDENYLDISVEDFKFQLGSTLEKRYLIKKIVHFIMYMFPYLILKKITERKKFTSYDEAVLYFKNLYDESPKEIKKLILREIDEIIKYSTNFLNSIQSVIKSSKKDTIDNVIDILEDQISKQNEYYQIFKEIINNTVNEKLLNLILAYYENDFENIAY